MRTKSKWSLGPGIRVQSVVITDKGIGLCLPTGQCQAYALIVDAGVEIGTAGRTAGFKTSRSKVMP